MGQGRAAITVALVVVGVLLLAFGVTTRTASAVEGSLRIESTTALVGETVSVDIVANVGPPGLGAWTVDPIWDASVVDATSCQPYAGAVCSTNFASDEGRTTGASMTGIVGETTLATFVFRCGSRQGLSQLQLSVEVFADATPDKPRDIEQTVDYGSILCVDRSLDPGSIRIDTKTGAPGAQLPVELVAENVPNPGLVEWSIDIHYDPDIVAVVGCQPFRNGSCSPQYGPGVVRSDGESSVRLAGSYSLAEFVFQCGDRRGTTALSLTKNELSSGLDQTFPNFVNGSIACSGPPVLPTSGQGGGPTTNYAWPIGLLALSGAALVLSAFVLRRRA